MKKYLIDVNLPRYFSLWASDEYQHIVDINDELKGSFLGGTLLFFA